MSAQTLPLALHALLAIALMVAAISDLRTRTIPNWLTGGLALLAPALWFAVGMHVWPDMAFQLGIGIAAFSLFAVFCALNAMGGGDVKLIGALALWLPLVPTVWMLITMSIIGGVLTILFWLRHRMTKSTAKLEIPYGVAIALAGLWAVYERYLNQFG
jgi:prepilin peptidase CpaA